MKGEQEAESGQFSCSLDRRSRVRVKLARGCRIPQARTIGRYTSAVSVGAFVGLLLYRPAFGDGPSTAAPGASTPGSTSDVEVHGDRASAPGQTGSSVAVLSLRDIQALPGGEAQTLTDVVLTQPGFAPDSFGSDGVLHIRGAEAGVLYVVDGVQIPGGLAGQFADVLPTQIVQSLRMRTGGLPVEYGPNAGGVIDVATRRGRGAPEGEFQMAYGTYQRIQPSVWYSQALGKADVFVEGALLSTHRGLDSPAANPVLHDDLLAGHTFAKLDYRLDAAQRIEVMARYSQYAFQIPIDPTLLPLSDGPPGATRGPDRYGNAPPVFVPYDANPTETERDLFAAVSYQRALAEGSLQLSPYVRLSYGDLNCDAAGSLGATADRSSACSNVTRRLLHAGQNATFAWAVGEEQKWKAGVVLDDAQSLVDYTQFTRDDSSPNGGPNPGLTLSGHDRTEFLSGGAFIEDEITLGRTKWLPGLRADVQNVAFEGTSQPNLLMAGPSLRLGMSYALSNELLLHAFVGALWQPPSAVDAAVAARVLAPSLAGQAVPDVKAEKDEYAEVGLSYRAHRRIAASLTAYGRFSQDQLDVLTVGSTNLVEDYNYARGRAAGAEMAIQGPVTGVLQGFGNVSWNLAQGQGVDSVRFLFTPSVLTYSGWQILDHVQSWSANAGLDLRDEAEESHLSVLFQYGSGLRTGADNTQTVPPHGTWNLTVRRRLDIVLHPEVAVDVLNLFDTAYAIRIANGFVGSAYGPLRQVDVRITIPFGGLGRPGGP
ncbi:MAG: TonB-dependent receptor [Polyangiaceae bacterium]|jgi:outer membrane cobalamin receptor